MTYERAFGMGWSDISGYPTCPQQPGGGAKQCYTTSPDDQARAQAQGCFDLREPCRTTSGTAGAAMCCPAMPRRHATDMRCYREILPRVSMQDPAEQNIWDMQRKLCKMGVDVGPINGQVGSASFRAAIKAYQARVGLSQTGNADEATLRSMGFSAQRSVDIAGSVANQEQGDRSDQGPGIGTMLNIPMLALVGSTLASVVLFLVWKSR